MACPDFLALLDLSAYETPQAAASCALPDWFAQESDLVPYESLETQECLRLLELYSPQRSSVPSPDISTPALSLSPPRDMAAGFEASLQALGSVHYEATMGTDYSSPQQSARNPIYSWKHFADYRAKVMHKEKEKEDPTWPLHLEDAFLDGNVLWLQARSGNALLTFSSCMQPCSSSRSWAARSSAREASCTGGICSSRSTSGSAIGLRTHQPSVRWFPWARQERSTACTGSESRSRATSKFSRASLSHIRCVSSIRSDRREAGHQESVALRF
jgi:hypothetical protein